ncbi:MAG: zinc ABC transporter substrate-binding protein [Desulfobacterales bacterium]|nr:zinc ABC transporter substrate-binding protein [Desulfobacterales bacterium]
MKIIIAATSLILCIICPMAVYAQDNDTNTRYILASFPATYSITAQLCSNTTLKALYLFPEKISMESQARYIKTHGKSLAETFKTATAVVSLRSAWPKDPLFPAARKENIRVVEIDAAMPFDRQKAGIPLLAAPSEDKKNRGPSPLLWLSLANASRMADIIGGDLERISPKDKIAISQNLKTFKQVVFKLRSTYESGFAQLDNLAVIALTTDFIYLTENFNIDVARYFLKPEIDWTNEDVADFEHAIRNNGINTVIQKWIPDQKIMDAIQNSGARLVVLDNINPGMSRDPISVDTYLDTMQQNLFVLADALK